MNAVAAGNNSLISSPISSKSQPALKTQEKNNLGENSGKEKSFLKVEINIGIKITKLSYSGANFNLKQKYQVQNELVDQTREFLNKYLNENPEALESIQNGEIPEYFNEENTARRILDIFFAGYNGEDREAFAERAKSIITQAYSDVQKIVGTGLPEIVLNTRDLIFEMIESFKNGEDKIFDFLGYGKDTATQSA